MGPRDPGRAKPWYVLLRRLDNLSPNQLAITAIWPEWSAELDITMCEVQYRLWQTGRLHDTSDFDGAFALYEFSDRVEESWREL